MKIKELRQQEKKKVKEIANLLGISVQSYYSYENNQTIPNLNTLTILADYYNVSLDYLVGRNFNNTEIYLRDDEKIMLENYRKMSDTNKKILLVESQGILNIQN